MIPKHCHVPNVAAIPNKFWLELVICLFRSFCRLLGWETFCFKLELSCVIFHVKILCSLLYSALYRCLVISQETCIEMYVGRNLAPLQCLVQYGELDKFFKISTPLRLKYGYTCSIQISIVGLQYIKGIPNDSFNLWIYHSSLGADLSMLQLPAFVPAC